MKKDKIVIAVLVLILTILSINIVYTIYEMIDYEARKESGNNRWLQVENRILQTEEKVNKLEQEMRQWKS